MKALLDWFIPDVLRANRTTLLQARCIVTIFFVSLLLNPGLSLLQYKFGVTGLTAANLADVVAWGVTVALLKMGAPFTLVRNLGASCVFLFFFYSALLAGGINGYPALWSISFPLLAVFFTGRKNGLVWGGVDMIAMLAMALLKPESFGVTPLLISEEGKAFLFANTLLSGISVVILLAYLFESFRESSYAELDLERRNAEDLARQVSRLLGEVSAALETVNRESSAIAGSAQHIAGSMVQQVVQATEVHDTMTSLHHNVIENAQRSIKAAQEAGSAGARAQAGGEEMNEAIADMGTVSDMVAEAAINIEELTQRSDEIGNIVNVIREIADQTNLLALNAAIEAARAGEQGRGFAVVADEVRKLAERTQSSTGEIGERVSGILGVTRQAMQSMSQARTLMQTGRDKATRAGQSLQEIIGRSESVAVVLHALANSGSEQTEANARMTERVGDIRRAVGDAHASTQEIAEATLRLENEIRSLSHSAHAIDLKA